MSQTKPGAVKLLVGRIGGVAGCLVLGQVMLGLTYVFAARTIGPASLGLIVTCVAIGTIGSTVFDLGLSNFQVREVASGVVTIARARSMAAAKRRLSPALILPSMVACVLIMPVPLDGLVLGITGWAIWEAQTANSLLRALERFTHAASAQIAGRGAGLVATVALSGVSRPDLALSLGLASSFLVEACIDRILLGSSSTRPATLAEMLATNRRAVPFGLVSLAAVGQQLDTPLVTAGGGAMAGGIYAGAGRLLSPLLFLSTSLALVGSPWLARSRSDPEALRAGERRIGRVALVLSAPPLIASALGPFVIPWILGPAFTQSGSAFSILAIGAVLSTISQGRAIILQNRGCERSVGQAITTGLTLGLITSYLFALLSGPTWAAVGFTVSQLFILSHLTLTTRRIRHSPPRGSPER